jgi:hypothetical protein
MKIIPETRQTGNPMKVIPETRQTGNPMKVIPETIIFIGLPV